MASNSIKNQQGLIALMTVLIVLAITLAVGIGLGLGSISETKMGLQKNQSSKAYYLANLCAEQALMKLKEDSGYAGNEATSTENGICEILPIEGTWTVKVSATSSEQTKKMRITISQINPKMIISSWEEVAGF